MQPYQYAGSCVHPGQFLSRITAIFFHDLSYLCPMPYTPCNPLVVYYWYHLHMPGGCSFSHCGFQVELPHLFLLCTVLGAKLPT